MGSDMNLDPKLAAEVRVLIPTGYGLNCEAETAAAFRMLGARVELLHVSELLADPTRLRGISILAFIGGFSFGDHVASGRVFANRLRFRLGDALARHVAEPRVLDEEPARLGGLDDDGRLTGIGDAERLLHHGTSREHDGDRHEADETRRPHAPRSIAHRLGQSSTLGSQGNRWASSALSGTTDSRRENRGAPVTAEM